MSVAGLKIKQSEQPDFEPVVLPEDSYQVSIDRVELRVGKKYMTEEDENQLLFYLKPLNVAPEFAKKVLFYQTTTSFFNGKSTSTKNALKASKLYGLIKTVYKFYKPEVKVDEMKAEQITDDVINELEGKQVMAIVALSETGKNKVVSLLSIKEEVKTGEVLTPDQELQKVLS